MKLSMYVLHDTVMDESAPPFTCKNNAGAVRMIVNHFYTNPNINPHDYKLYYLGTFDTETRVIELSMIEGGAPVNFIDELELRYSERLNNAEK